MDTQGRIGTDGGINENNEDTANGEGVLNALPPEKLLETDDADQIRAGIRCMESIGTVKQYVAYENSHRQRGHILQLLQDRAAKLRGQE